MNDIDKRRVDTILPPAWDVHRGHLYGIAASFGFDADQVTRIVIEPDRVTISTTGGFEHELPVVNS